MEREDSDAYVDLVTQICEELCRGAGLFEDDYIIEAGFRTFDHEMKATRRLDNSRKAALQSMRDFDNHQRRN